MGEISKEFWRTCSQCKKKLGYSANYFECSVSTCSRKRTGYVFCSLICWESHVPGANHRNAGAIEKKSPTYAEWLAENADVPSNAMSQTSSTATSSGTRRIVTASGAPAPVRTSSMSHEVLVVVSKMKQYIKDQSEMNTSADVNEVLSDIIRRACDKAIDHARADGRKTVMARDFKF